MKKEKKVSKQANKQTIKRSNDQTSKQVHEINVPSARWPSWAKCAETRALVAPATSPQHDLHTELIEVSTKK